MIIRGWFVCTCHCVALAVSEKVLLPCLVEWTRLLWRPRNSGTSLPLSSPLSPPFPSPKSVESQREITTSAPRGLPRVPRPILARRLVTWIGAAGITLRANPRAELVRSGVAGLLWSSFGGLSGRVVGCSWR